MKLIGDNYLRCIDVLYYVPMDANFHFQYFIGHGNAAAAGNGLYEEVMNRDPAHLSVLSTWEFHLVNPNSEPGRSQDFIDDEIDLHLKGVFQFVHKADIDIDACWKHEMTKNYRIDRIIL